MGASKYKKVRSEERSSGALSPRELAEQAAQKKTRRNHILTVVGAVAAVLLIAAVILINSTFFDTRVPAVTIGDDTFTAAEVRYAKQMSYSSFCSSNSSFLSYLLDTSKPLDEQQCMFNSEITWDEYFLQEGLNYLRQTTALYNAAIAEGYTLTEDDAALIDSNLEMISLSASTYGYTTDGYIAACYGEGNNERSVRAMMERSLIASAYANDKQESLAAALTGEELDEYYAENRDSYNTVSYLTALVPYKTEETDSSGDGENSEVTEEEKAAARTKVDNILGISENTVDSFRAAVLIQLGSEPTESRNAPANFGENREWFASGERKEGDVLTVEEGTGIRLYCYLRLEDNSYNTVSARHILIKAEDTDGDGAYSDEEKAAALSKLESVRDQWDGSEENFIELVKEYSQDAGSVDNGGLYEDIYKGQMVSEFNDFVFGDDVKSGDSAIVYGESSAYAGYHLIYFVGEGESYARTLARNAISSERLQSWQTELVGDAEVEEGFMYRYI